jgi:hypothetical protein
VFPEEIRNALDEFFEEYSTVPFNQREFNNLKNNQSLL